MSGYVDKDTLVNRLKEHCTTIVKERWFDDYLRGYSAAIGDIMAEPTADVPEVKHGHWLPYNGTDGWSCSECGHAANERILKGYQEINGDTCDMCYQSAKPFYCSRCGAKMDLEDGIK